MTTIELLDFGTRVFWMVARAAGVFFILSCWRAERQRFHLWLAASWALTSLWAAVRLMLPNNEPARMFLSLVVAPGSVITGLVGYAKLRNYLRRRISTLRIIGAEVHARSFEDEDERPTVRPSR